MTEMVDGGKIDTAQTAASFEALAADPPLLTAEDIAKDQAAAKAKADKVAAENKKASEPENKAEPKGGKQ